jgi:nucleotide-binding universal stress UspA family protein
MYKRIIVPVDGSDTSNLGLSEAIAFAKDQGATLRLVHIVEDRIISDTVDGTGVYADNFIEALREGGKSILEKAEAESKKYGVKAESVMLEHFGGQAAGLIIEEAKNWKADLIVLGTHGRKGITRLVLGSSAEEVVRTAPVPVLLIRSTTPDAS